jgi:predicted permease
MLRRNPAFTAVAVLSLSLGLGAAAAVFSVADAVLFRPLPVADPSSLRDFRVSMTFGGTSSHKEVFGADESQVRVLAETADFADIIGFRTVDDVSVDAGAGSQLVRAEFVSPAYFPVLGVPARTGRLFHRNDSASSPVPVVISERFSRTALPGGDSAVNRPIRINNRPAVVVGVVRGFRGLLAERPADVFVPLSATAELEPAATALMVRIALRLHPGVATTVAEQKMAALYRALGPSMAKAGELQLTLGDASRGLSGARERLVRPMALGLALVAVLLIVACANTGALLLARFAARQTEFGIRVAIGAGRARLVRQLFIEALLLAILAGFAALLIARVTAPLIASAIPFVSEPIAFDVRFDWRVVTFTGVIASAAAFLAGALTLAQVLRSGTSRVLNAGTRSIVRGRRRTTEALVAAQIGCSLLLLVAAAAMGRTLVNLRQVDPGFDPSDTIALTVDANAALPERSQSPAYFNRLFDALAAIADVGRISMVQMGLFTPGMTTGTIDVPGHPPANDEDRWTRLFFVGPDFFETVGMRLVAGRGLTAGDMTGRQRVAVVTEQFARFFFGSPHEAVGRIVNRDLLIVGVAADAKFNTFRDAPARALFLPYTQSPPRPVMTLIVKPAADQRRTIDAVVPAIARHDPRLKVRVTTLADQAAATVGVERFAAATATTLTFLALCLACAGVYSTVAHAVSERRSELAIRLALGATPNKLIRAVMRDPVRLALAGIALAVPCTYALMRTLSSLLFGVSAFDLPTLLASAAGLILTTAAAAALPAWRASTIDPHECLKAQ